MHDRQLVVNWGRSRRGAVQTRVFRTTSAKKRAPIRRFRVAYRTFRGAYRTFRGESGIFCVAPGTFCVAPATFCAAPAQGRGDAQAVSPDDPGVSGGATAESCGIPNDWTRIASKQRPARSITCQSRHERVPCRSVSSRRSANQLRSRAKSSDTRMNPADRRTNAAEPASIPPPSMAMEDASSSTPGLAPRMKEHTSQLRVPVPRKSDAYGIAQRS
jgi:hypothetical protein